MPFGEGWVRSVGRVLPGLPPWLAAGAQGMARPVLAVASRELVEVVDVAQGGERR
jgi:hypothetical protein